MPVTITRRLEIDAGHRLQGHESKCANAHGHRYVFEIEATAAKLDTIGRVIDFSVLKAELGNWLDENWDHGFIYEAGDPIGQWLSDNAQKRFVLATPPTAENLAQFFLQVARGRMVAHGIEIVSVKIYETPNCTATAR